MAPIARDAVFCGCMFLSFVLGTLTCLVYVIRRRRVVVVARLSDDEPTWPEAGKLARQRARRRDLAQTVTGVTVDEVVAALAERCRQEGDALKRIRG